MPDPTPPTPLDELDRQLRRALLRANDQRGQDRADLLHLAGTLHALVDLLAAAGLIDRAEVAARLGAAEGRLLAADAERRPKVTLGEPRDKYVEANAEVDCAARFPVCHSACCSLEVPLSVQDLEEGVVRWDLGRPYYLRHGDDGRCFHQDRGTYFCGLYENRPTPCRSYSCRDDRRIWRDFDQRIPNPKGIAALLGHALIEPLQLVRHRPTVTQAAAAPEEDGTGPE